jgi:hypothetical protein
MAPTAAASVGVAMPPRMEPSTATISTIGGTSARVSSRPEMRPAYSFGIAGAMSGRRKAMTSW